MPGHEPFHRTQRQDDPARSTGRARPGRNKAAAGTSVPHGREEGPSWISRIGRATRRRLQMAAPVPFNSPLAAHLRECIDRVERILRSFETRPDGVMSGAGFRQRRLTDFR